MRNTEIITPGYTSTNIQIESGYVTIEWSDADESISFNHSFSERNFFYRRIAVKNQMLVKACSNKQRSIRSVLDMTAGWGIDSFILAQHGKQITMLEQNSVVYDVISQSLVNASNTTYSKTAAQRIKLVQGNSFKFLESPGKSDRYDCIYIDPMFPAHHSKAKPGKDMQLLQKLTGNFDIDNCFELALKKACHRVVVKRPAKAANLSLQKPDLTYREKTIRYDVYLTHNE